VPSTSGSFAARPEHPRSVLITGCSTGIGRATALHLARRGWTVFATARRPETIAALADAGCRTLALDLCDEDSMRVAVDEVEQVAGALGVLVNNAGYGLQGPVEELDLGDVRDQFEANVFGPLRLTQLVLPGMRRQGWGRIVNVGSLAGRFSLPAGGAYHASKYAIEALSDALRFEVRGFGIAVVLVEPGAIRSRWVDKAVATLAPPTGPGPYEALRETAADQLRAAHRGLLRLTARSPEAVARVIERALESGHPAPRYVVPNVARVFLAAPRLLPDRVWDALLRHRYPSPGAEDVSPPEDPTCAG